MHPADRRSRGQLADDIEMNRRKRIEGGRSQPVTPPPSRHGRAPEAGGVEAGRAGPERMPRGVPAPFPAKGLAGPRRCPGEASRARSRSGRRRIREHAGRCRHAVLAAGLLTAALAGAVSAETPGRPPHAGGVASIGTHVPGSADRGLLPITVIDRGDIERSGIRYLGELLLSRSAFNAFGVHRAHFLGNGQTMVLVNGRRLSRTMLGDDEFNLVPVSAVERIEILGVGGAAAHGGDALAGAINIVTRRGLQGPEVQLHAGRPGARGGNAEHASVLWGGGAGNGRLTIGAGVFRRQEIRDADRDYSRARWTPGGSFADTEGVSVAGNTFFYPAGGATRAGYLGDCDTARGYAGPLAAPYGRAGEGCGFAHADIDWQWTREERDSLFASAELPLGDDRTLHGDARIARGKMAYRGAPAHHRLSVRPPQPLLDAIRTRYPDFPADFDGALDVSHRFVGHGNHHEQRDIADHDLAIALRGRFGSGPAYEAYARYHDYGFDLTDGARLGDGITEEIEQGRYRLDDPFSQDPTHRAAIRNTSMTKNWEWASTRKTAGLSFHDRLPAPGDREFRWAAGLELDHEAWKDLYDYRDAGNRPVSHEALLLDGDGSSSGERRIASAFGEVLVSLADGWDVLVNARGDEHDDVGGAFSYRVAGRGQLSENFALRGSWSESARPPFLGALHYTPYVRRPRACLSEDDCRRFVRTYGGNPELEPDRTKSLSAGLLADAGPVSLSFDWFAFRVSDLPAIPSTQSIVDLHLAGQALPAGVAITERNGVIDSIRGGFSNSGEMEASGLDLQARFAREASWGNLGFDVYWSHDLHYEYRVLDRLQPTDRPRDRVHVAATVQRGKVTASWNVLGRSGVDNDHNRYGSWFGHDVVIGWDDALGLRGLTLTGGVLNVGDRQPSVNSARDDAPVLDLDAARGRTFFVSLRFSPGG